MAGNPKQVVIVGGGIAGLATAFALQERAALSGRALRCVLLEAGRSWGGKIATHHVGDLLIEAGPDSFLSQKPQALELCAALGLSDQVINANEEHKKTFVYSRGRLRELPEGLVLIVPTKLGPFLRSGLLSLPGLGRMALDLVIPAQRAEADESVATFFCRRFGREAFERLIEPLMAGIYAGDAEQMSLQATFPRFAELERRHGSLIRGMVASRRAAIAAPRPGPARTMFVSLRNGLDQLVQALVRRLEQQGVDLRLGAPVEGIRVRSNRPGSWIYDVILGYGSPLAGDAVILATPAYVSADLVRPLSPSAAEWLAGIPYASTATIAMAYDVAAVQASVHGFGFIVPRVEGRRLLAATWSSLKWSQRAPKSQVLVRCYTGGVGREEILERDDKAILTAMREELRDLAGVMAEPLYAEINRWDRAMPQYLVGHLERLTHIETALSVYPGLLLTGAGYRGIGIPDCIREGAQTADAVLAHLSGARPRA